MPRRFTLAELTTLLLTADRIRREVDAELGAAVERLALGDESEMATICDRLNVCGRFAEAERVRRVALRGE